ncbi:MAG: hypothetical protein KAI83_06275 [Thiomargarita sp.]|nr:hypothetical protein [Thiomargarita sp.]
MKKYTHCLRPLFTENIVKTLAKGESVNIYGAKGQGRKRLLEDLKDCQFENMQMLLVNMRNFANSYQGFVEALAKEIGFVGKTIPRLATLLDELEQSNKDGKRKTVILLHHFNSLFDNDRLHPDYGIRFFDNLNAIKNRDNMALVCVTEKKHNSYMIYAKAVVDHGSWLDLKPKRLPELDSEQIAEEMQRHFSGLYSAESNPFNKIVTSHSQPYSLLEYMVDRLENREDADIPFAKRLEKWRKQFDKENPLLTSPNANKMVQGFSNWLGALRIGGLFDKLTYGFPNAIVDIVKLITRRNK